MQTAEWARFKSRHGWHYHHLLGLYVLSHPLKFGLEFCYIPEITVPSHHTASATFARAQAALSRARTASTVFGRAEFLIPYHERDHTILLHAGFVKAKDEVQPAWRQVIDISGSLASIRDTMRPKGRYNLGLAEKKGVTVHVDLSGEAEQAFMALNRATAARKGYVGREGSYLSDLMHTLAHHKMGGLWVATYQNTILSAAMVSFYGTRASYLYGVSSSLNRAVMSPYLLHMAIIHEAKQRGCTEYDLIGIAPVDAREHHPWAGMTRFKREFGGSSVRYLGAYDRIYRPALYTLYRAMRKNNG